MYYLFIEPIFLRAKKLDLELDQQGKSGGRREKRGVGGFYVELRVLYDHLLQC